MKRSNKKEKWLAFFWISSIIFGFGIHLYFSIQPIRKITDEIAKRINWITLAIESLIFLQIATINIFLFWGRNGNNIETANPNHDYDERVTILIPIKNPNLSYFEETVKAIGNLTYPRNKLTVMVGDDTTEQELKLKIKELCNNYGLFYFHSGTQKKFKAGMVNILLQKVKDPYFIILDYDQVPVKDLIDILLSEFKKTNDENLAFVQAIKRFNRLKTISSYFSALLYLQNFEVIETPKNNRKTVLFVGSTAMFKTSAIKSINGFSYDSITEDTDTTIKLMVHGYYGKLVKRIGSWGKSPLTYKEQISQLWRWALGAGQSIRVNLKNLIFSKNLSVVQKLDVLTTIGIAFIVPLLFLYGLIVSFLGGIGINLVRPSLQINQITVSTYILLPLFELMTYLVILVFAFKSLREEETTRVSYKWRLIPIMTIIGISTTVLIMFASILGFLKYGMPSNPKSVWNRNVHLFRNSIIFALLGLGLIGLGYNLMINQFSSGILIFIEGIVFLFPITVSSFLALIEN